MAMGLRILAHTVNILRHDGSGPDDEYGLKQDQWVASSVGIRARVQHHNSWEERDGRLLKVQNWRAYLPADTDVTEKDRLEWPAEGRTFEIIVVEPVADMHSTHHLFLMLQDAH